jgi:hypothetical protein
MRTSMDREPVRPHEMNRIVNDAKAHVLDTILADVREFLHSYLGCYVRRYGSLENVPKGAVVTWEDYDNTNFSKDLREIYVTALVETCGRAVREATKMECLFLAEQTETFLEYYVLRHGVRTLYDDGMEFIAHQLNKYIMTCQAFTDFREYMLHHEGRFPPIPPRPHYPF